MATQRSRRNLMLMAPVLAAVLLSITVRLLGGDVESPESELLNEVGFSWWLISALGLAGALYGARAAQSSRSVAAAMFFLVPLWGLTLAAVDWGAEGAQKARTICGPASREVVAAGSIGEIYGTFVLAFAWSAALSLCCAAATLMERRPQETGLAVSLGLAGLSFTAASLHAGAIHLALTGGLYDIEVLRGAAAQADNFGIAAGGLMVAALFAAFASAQEYAASPRRVLLLGACTVVPLLNYAMALESTVPLTTFMNRRLPRAVTVNGLAPLTEQPFHLWASTDWRLPPFRNTHSEILGIQLAVDASTLQLRHVLLDAYRKGFRDVEIQGTPGGILPLSLEGAERRVAIVPSATRLRLLGAEPCSSCAVRVSSEPGGLRVIGADGSAEFWPPAKLAAGIKVTQYPTAEWVGPELDNQALIDASLIALAHHHVLLLRVR